MVAETTLYVLVYVDDIVITGNIYHYRVLLNSEFSLKDIGDLHYSLGIEVTRSYDCLYLCQRKYI
ncbi:Copia protein [Gossypium australe]|uniref:Copia protein n=1 Tax=Gossypium australe TaxID=47621 RepID=A0A5B6WJ60_9ROSI|nr:Copia protein [Gossypium australe]